MKIWEKNQTKLVIYINKLIDENRELKEAKKKLIKENQHKYVDHLININNKDHDIRFFTIAILTTGLTYSWASTLLNKLDISHLSESAFYWMKIELVEEIISTIDVGLKNLIQSASVSHHWGNLFSQGTKRVSLLVVVMIANTTIVFDGCCTHPRQARQCLLVFIDSTRGLVIDHFGCSIKSK